MEAWVLAVIGVAQLHIKRFVFVRTCEHGVGLEVPPDSDMMQLSHSGMARERKRDVTQSQRLSQFSLISTGMRKLRQSCKLESMYDLVCIPAKYSIGFMIHRS